MAIEKVNRVFLAGTLRTDPVNYEKQVSALIDVGMAGAVPVSVYTGKGQNADLARQMACYRQGDEIQVQAIIKPWSVKQNDGSRKFGFSVDVVRIADRSGAKSKTAASLARQPGDEADEQETLAFRPMTRYSADAPPANWADPHHLKKVLK